MTTINPGPTLITAEQFAEHLRWLLGNHNFEVGDLDAASDAWMDEGSTEITVNVSAFNLATRVGGSQQFTLTVAEVADSAEEPHCNHDEAAQVIVAKGFSGEEIAICECGAYLIGGVEHRPVTP